jgi:hypothetical protein
MIDYDRINITNFLLSIKRFPSDGIFGQMNISYAQEARNSNFILYCYRHHKAQELN